MKLINDSTFLLLTGKEVYANNGIIGINNDADSISEGYDSGLWSFDFNGDYEPDDYGYLTKEELIEISDYMIERWNEFKKKVGM